jgi:hypothetical protein
MTFRRRLWSLFVALAAVPAASVCGPSSAAGEESFRIENEIFVDGEKEPQIRSTTVFHRGVVYDYLADPAEVTVLDVEHGRFVLLDLDRRIKTELPTERVAEFCDRLRERLQNRSDPFVRFLCDPHFEQTLDESAGELTFTSPWMTYRVLFGSESQSLSRRYRDFSDWYCRLNTILNPGARPPFARMIVNAALEDRQLFPREVHLTIQPKEGLLAKRITVRSKHRLIRQLVESDRKRVSQTDQFMAMYASVDFREYQRQVAN